MALQGTSREEFHDSSGSVRFCRRDTTTACTQ